MTSIKIHGMTCQHCIDAVTRALKAASGVKRVIDVNLEQGEALVEGTPDTESVTYFVELAGYRAEVIK
jgi:copper chaperone